MASENLSSSTSRFMANKSDLVFPYSYSIPVRLWSVIPILPEIITGTLRKNNKQKDCVRLD